MLLEGSRQTGWCICGVRFDSRYVVARATFRERVAKKSKMRHVACLASWRGGQVAISWQTRQISGGNWMSAASNLPA